MGIADILGLNPSHVSRVLRGYGPELSDRVINAICVRTGISYRYFVENPEGRPFTEFLTLPDITMRWAESRKLDEIGGRAAKLLLRYRRGADVSELEVRELAELVLTLEPFNDARVIAVRKTDRLTAFDFVARIVELEEAIHAYAGGGAEARQARQKFRSLIGADETDGR
ncbi:MAG: hypothetical protein M5U28_27140 [Sandaracinaceae bacterium]|nr:hypothetical protein [Sandaracinaceae bacterium]